LQLSPCSIIILFAITGVAAIISGLIFLHISQNVSEISIDYTNCIKSDADPSNSNLTCAEYLAQHRPFVVSCECNINFDIASAFSGPVYFYYRLTNFYQNHWKFLNSRDHVQLLGNFSSISSNCRPFDVDNATEMVIVPCGAIANSLFNDTLQVTSLTYGPVPVLRTGIAFEFDREVLFSNPENLKKGKIIEIPQYRSRCSRPESHSNLTEKFCFRIRQILVFFFGIPQYRSRSMIPILFFCSVGWLCETARLDARLVRSRSGRSRE
jgi:LEM3 (ligand-effect modulator 3) family / CDC50 family